MKTRVFAHKFTLGDIVKVVIPNSNEYKYGVVSEINFKLIHEVGELFSEQVEYFIESSDDDGASDYYPSERLIKVGHDKDYVKMFKTKSNKED
jgi:hypothetical protein